jgi:hypothetical protein
MRKRITPPAAVVRVACQPRESPRNLPTGRPMNIVPPAKAARITVWAKLI